MRLGINVKEVLTPEAAAQIAPLNLAYIGDSVFDLYVRTALVTSCAGNTGVLHIKSSGVVNARAQAAFAHGIIEELSERERNVFMRGRNAKSATVPKNMSVADYRYATAAEALIGYLFLSGQEERMDGLLALLDDKIFEENVNGQG